MVYVWCVVYICEYNQYITTRYVHEHVINTTMYTYTITLSYYYITDYPVYMHTILYTILHRSGIVCHVRAVRVQADERGRAYTQRGAALLQGKYIYIYACCILAINVLSTTYSGSSS